ncbi:flavodoxin family protein [Actinokineospora bangkokensis]|uniref:Flavodoxin n=1 Tax=Actinokineospora bangkokensis TaxID=1193682 RepID=A0A1Q9LEM5_9PSEU|nr:NAD(P)H-dependent oxidoreductase [Actinokineospora bangkokensis]OLR90472.1 flavodoxin [Actinokineospora bangkokensis]
MPRLLIVHHTPSPACQAMFEAVVRGTSDPDLADVEVVRRAALSATAHDVLHADGVVLGTPANIGYISGALKHFFDTVYYPVLDSGRGTPFGCYIHGNQGTEGAERAIATITNGLGWQRVAADVVVAGEPSTTDLGRCAEMGATVAATLLG